MQAGTARVNDLPKCYWMKLVDPCFLKSAPYLQRVVSLEHVLDECKMWLKISAIQFVFVRLHTTKNSSIRIQCMQIGSHVQTKRAHKRLQQLQLGYMTGPHTPKWQIQKCRNNKFWLTVQRETKTPKETEREKYWKTQGERDTETQRSTDRRKDTHRDKESHRLEK